MYYVTVWMFPSLLIELLYAVISVKVRLLSAWASWKDRVREWTALVMTIVSTEWHTNR
jgi:hypothetical protein